MDISAKELIIAGMIPILNKITGPLAKEVGLFLSTNFRVHRLNNLDKTIKKSLCKFTYENDKLQLSHMPPKLIFNFLESASLEDNEEIQDLWAGLLYSSCHVNELETNSIYINILKNLTLFQVRILSYVFKNLNLKEEEGYIINDTMIKINFTDVINENENISIDHIVSQINHLNFLGFLESIIGRTQDRIKDGVIFFPPTNFCIDFVLKVNGFPNVNEYMKSKKKY